MSRPSLVETMFDKTLHVVELGLDPSTFGHLELGRASLLLGLGLYGLTIVAGIWGQATGDRRCVVMSRNSLLTAGVAVAVAAGSLVHAFLVHDYSIAYVFNYSEKSLPFFFKVAGLWAGLDGSILLWAMLTGFLGAIVAAQTKRDESHPVARRLEPTVHVVLGIIQFFFLFVILYVADPFQTLTEKFGEGFSENRFGTPVPEDGSGLTPLLVNYWMQIHPPTMYIGWVIYSVPFAYGIAALVSGEQGSYWVRRTRRWMMAGWLFNTIGIVLGGLWAYEVLGWGGYWGWDPVENASFLPWFTASAFMHSVMMQERREMLRGWNVFLVAATFGASLFGTWLTRSGVVSSVHAFASGDIGVWFQYAWLSVAAITVFLLAFRWDSLKSENQIESAASREAVFVLNNVILVAMPVIIATLTLWPKITKELTGNDYTLQVPIYNRVLIPCFFLMLLMTAIGPALGWLRTTPRRLARNTVAPAILALPIAGAVHGLVLWVRGDEGVPVSLFEHFAYGFGFIYLGTYIATSLLYELHRAVSSRLRRKDSGYLAALGHTVLQHHRRYGGYTVHIGMGLMAIGITASSLYKVETEAHLKPGEWTKSGDLSLRFDGIREQAAQIGQPYDSTRVVLEVFAHDEGGEPAGDPIQLEPELRLYRTNQFRLEPSRTTEVSILHQPLQDVWVYWQPTSDGETFLFTINRNPLIALVWGGWLLMLAGAVFAALPIGGRRVGLSD